MRNTSSEKATESKNSFTLGGAILVAWLVLSVPSAGLAQPPAPTRVISGSVVDAETNAPIDGAIVFAGKATAVTSPDGHFSLRVAATEASVTVTAAGRFPLTTQIDTRGGDVGSLELALTRDPRFATSVDVVAASAPVSPTATTIEPLQVLRTPGALDNVFRTLQTMPGVAAAEEFGSRLSVRGGAPDQNLTVMDGVEVHDPYRLYGLTSAFNPETIQRFELATGGFSAKYGDRLSSLLVIENRDGRVGEGLAGSAALSATDGNMVFEGGLPFGAKGSWLVTGRRTYYDLVAARVTAQKAYPAFGDLQARATWALSDRVRITGFSLTSRQSAAIKINDVEARGEFQDDTANDLAWARLDATLGARLQSRTVFGYSNTRSTFGVDGRFQNDSQRSNAPAAAPSVQNIVFDHSLNVMDRSVRQEFTWPQGRHAVEAGVEVHRLATLQRYSVQGDRNPTAANGSSLQGGAGLPDLLESSQDSTRAGAWLQDFWQVSRRVSLQTGLRLDRSSITRLTTLSPRLSGTLALNDRTHLVVASGLYTQSPGYEKLAQSDYVLDLTAETGRGLVSEKAWNSSLALSRDIGRGVTVKLVGYYKRFSDILLGRLETEAERAARVARYDFPAELQAEIPVAPIITTTPVNAGRGRAYGFDVFVERTRGRLSGWTSYTWGRADREAYGTKYAFDYDRRHAFTVVSAFKASPNWEIAATTRIASGFPRTIPVGVRVAGAGVDAPDANGIKPIVPASDAQGRLEYVVDYGAVDNLNRGRLPVFARIDARLTWRPRGAAGRWEFYAEVLNVLNRKNAGTLEPQLQYDPTSDRPMIVEKPDQGIPRLPTIGLRFRF